MPTSFEERLAVHYDGLSARLREAGDYVASNPLDIASRSLRTVAEESGLAPATFTRLAKALDYPNFEELRESMRRRLSRRQNSFAARADALRGRAVSEGGSDGAPDGGLLGQFREACVANIDMLTGDIDKAQLETIADQLHAAKRVLVFGALGSTGIAEYAAYIGHFLGDGWSPAGRMGASVGADIASLGAEDALIVLTMPPFASLAARVAERARAQGAYVFVVTDTLSCPALRHASARVIVPSESPNFFSSYVAAIFLLELLTAMVAIRTGTDATERIAEVEAANLALGEVEGP